MVQTHTGSSASFSTTLSVAYAPAPTAGRLLVVVVGIRNAAADGVASVSLTTGGTWTAAPFNTVTSPGVQIYYKTALGTEGTITATANTSTRMAMAIYEFSGVSTTLDKSATQFGASTSSSPVTTTATSVIPTKAPNLAIVAAVAHTNTTSGAGGTWTTFTNTFTETDDVASEGSNGRVCMDVGFKVSASLGTISTQNTHTPAPGAFSTGWRTGMVEFLSSSPTAADGVVSGAVTDSAGLALPGTVVALSGSEQRKTITDAQGHYRFDNVETSGFYTVTPARANYTFTPSSRSFSLVGSRTEAVFTADGTGDNANPLDTPEYFVRQQYVDLLKREPDEAGFNYWSDQILQCGDDAACTRTRWIEVAAAFFVEREFQQTGAYIYDVYQAALGRQPVFGEYSTDRGQVADGKNLEASKTAFAESFVQREEFVQRYQANTTAESFVAALLLSVQSSGLDLSSRRDSLMASYNSGDSLVQSRALVVRAIADDATFRQVQYNSAFVLTEYFSYLRRNPDQGGYDFWVNVLSNNEPGNYRGLVCAFVTSSEYQRRFSSIVTRSNGECGQ